MFTNSPNAVITEAMFDPSTIILMLVERRKIYHHVRDVEETAHMQEESKPKTTGGRGDINDNIVMFNQSLDLH